MHIDRLEVFTYPVPFKTVFRHSSASRRRAENLIVAAHADNGLIGYGEGCPRDYVTGETIGSGAAFIREHANNISLEVTDTQALFAWTNAHRELIDRNPAAFCAVELAILDLFGKIESVPLEDLLDVPRLSGIFTYTAVLGDAPRLAYRWQLRRYRNQGFSDYKVKLSGNQQRDSRNMEDLIRKSETPLRIRLDANNHWNNVDECIHHITVLPGKFFAIEEPVQAGDLNGFSKVGNACGVRIILDESFTRIEQMDSLQDNGLWLLNVRVSKMGGLHRSLEIVKEALARGIGVIVGAQVGETSILTRAGLTVMNTARPLLEASEGAFGTYLLRQDLTTKCLRFGYKGEYPVNNINSKPGLGLNVRGRSLLPAA